MGLSTNHLDSRQGRPEEIYLEYPSLSSGRSYLHRARPAADGGHCWLRVCQQNRQWSWVPGQDLSTPVPRSRIRVLLSESILVWIGLSLDISNDKERQGATGSRDTWHSNIHWIFGAIFGSDGPTSPICPWDSTRKPGAEPGKPNRIDAKTSRSRHFSTNDPSLKSIWNHLGTKKRH